MMQAYLKSVVKAIIQSNLLKPRLGVEHQFASFSKARHIECVRFENE